MFSTTVIQTFTFSDLDAFHSITVYTSIKSVECYQADVNYAEIKCKWTAEPRASRYYVTVKHGESSFTLGYETHFSTTTISSHELQFGEEYEVGINGKSVKVSLRGTSHNQNHR